VRPHLLELTAFGPFSDTEQVDFDELADAGLFLLHGDTGAGKTTLLDALSFALYGSVPGARGKSPRLRSDHASPSVAPEVRLDFSVGGSRWRITRQPSWRRPKQRGSGTTEAKASVLLERWTGSGWSTVSTRFDEVGEEIKNAVGMTAEQFCQVVLLPQGGFARFLHASVDERGELLQRLFGTERFERVEQWLKRRAADLNDQLRDEQRQISELEVKICQVAGPETDPVADPAVADASREIDGPYAAGLLRRAQVDQERARHAADAANAEWGLRKDEHAALVARVDRAASRAEVLADLDALRTDAPRFRELSDELARARRAATVRPLIDAAETAETGRTAAIRAEEQARAALVGIDLGDSPDRAVGTEAGPDVLAQWAREAEQRVGSLEALRPSAAELDTVVARIEEAERAADERRDAIQRTENRLIELDALIVDGQAAVAAAQQAAVDVETRRSSLKDLTHAGERIAERELALAAVSVLENQTATARTAMQDARDAFQECRQAYLDGLAARLATQLADGDPCPVCGGVEHPAPATPDAALVGDAELAASEAAYERARATLAALEQDLVGARHRVDAAHAELRKSGHAEFSAATIAELLRTATSELAATEAAADGLADAQRDLVTWQDSRADSDKELAALRAADQAAAATVAHERTRAEQLRSTLRKHLGDHPDLNAALAAHSTAARLLAEAASAAAERQRADDAAAREGAAADRSARKAGFADVDSCRAGARSDQVIEQLEAALAAYTQAQATAQARLDDLAPDPLSTEDLAVAESRARAIMDEAEAAFYQRVAQLGVAEERHTALVQLVPALTDLLAAQAPRLAELETVRGLSDVVVGDGANHRRMALSSYVLAARLEEVAAAASERLLRMTNGRYTLLHADTAPDARRRWGLGLRVRDAWTGEDRETGSLSGGETFLASLALALGLADVVTAEAGGSRIDALFVDEGFGTLDENTLEDVLTVLDGLREGGRMVGLVSHVAELRTRIPMRLEVLKTPTGSTLRRPVRQAA